MRRFPFSLLTSLKDVEGPQFLPIAIFGFPRSTLPISIKLPSRLRRHELQTMVAKPGNGARPAPKRSDTVDSLDLDNYFVC